MTPRQPAVNIAQVPIPAKHTVSKDKGSLKLNPLSQGGFFMTQQRLISGFYNKIQLLIENNGTLLDLACGDGAFLRIALDAGVHRAVGVELTEQGVLRCVEQGLTVYQGDITEGLAGYPDRSFDCVSLIRTIELLEDPEPVLDEMLRVGQFALLTFINYSQLCNRLKFLCFGETPGVSPGFLRGPKTRLSYPVFKRYCRIRGITIIRQISFPSGLASNLFPGLFAEETAVLLRRE
jgi:methionine biosynthesis protein MetW